MTTLIRIIDTETTGLDHALDRICEVATVDLLIQDTGITRGRMWSSLVNPQRPISPEAMAVHDITDEMVKDAPLISDLLGIIKHVDDTMPDKVPTYWCAHNSRFDSKFINPVLNAVWIDTYRAALVLWPEAPSHKNSVLRYWLGLKLDPAACGENARSHRALWDAYVTAALLRKMLMCGATIEELVEWSSKPALLPKLGFGEHATKPIEQVPASYLQWILDKFEATKEDERHTAFTELQRRRQAAA